MAVSSQVLDSGYGNISDFLRDKHAICLNLLRGRGPYFILGPHFISICLQVMIRFVWTSKPVQLKQIDQSDVICDESRHIRMG
jgi:hypothetical protein